MKAVFIVLIISALSGVQKLSAQQIIAGQISGSGIVYSNPDDIQLYSDLVNTSCFYSLDIDQDGLFDMDFYATYFYYSHIDQRGTNTGINLNYNTQISRLDTLQYSTFQHRNGDTINSELNWIPGQMATLNSYSNVGVTEYFKDEGYIGFRICGTDTIYGWIHAKVTGNTETAKIIIYDYAYFTKPNSIDREEDKSVISCLNPVHDKLIIRIPDGNSALEWKCSVYDIVARNLVNKELSEDVNNISTACLVNGTYFVVIHNNIGKRYIFKIVKN